MPSAPRWGAFFFGRANKERDGSLNGQSRFEPPTHTLAHSFFEAAAPLRDRSEDAPLTHTHLAGSS